MSDLQKFTTLFFSRITQPLQIVGKKIYQSLPQAIKSKLLAFNLSLIAIILLFLVLWLNYFWPRNLFVARSLAVVRWPNSVKKHVELAKTLFDLGDLSQAQEEIQLAKKYYKYWQVVDISGGLKKAIDEGDQYINQKAAIESQINNLETILQDKPHYRDVYLQLSIRYYQLWQNDKAKEYWNKAFYLDPNNEIVQKVGRELGLFQN